MRKITALLISLSVSCSVFARGGGGGPIHVEVSEQLGDVGQFLLAGVSLLAISSEQDLSGLPMYAEAVGSSQLLAIGLKHTIKEPRPRNPELKNSFPSGHATFAFSSAGFLHRRYGIIAGIPSYAVATMVAYSRVHVGAHHNRDVIAGAVIGIGANFIFTKPYHPDLEMGLNPYANQDSHGLMFSAKW